MSTIIAGLFIGLMACLAILVRPVFPMVSVVLVALASIGALLLYRMDTEVFTRGLAVAAVSLAAPLLVDRGLLDPWLILAAFSAFVIKGVYPFWTLLLIGAMFLQFILTSGLRRPVYDPVGKYYGVFLFAAIGVTLGFPKPTVYNAVLVGVVGFTVASVASRAVFLLSRWRKAIPH